MQRKFILILTILFFILNFWELFAFDRSGMTFLKLPVEARSAGMGEAVVSSGQDAAAVFWNPALLPLADRKSLVMMHNIYFADITQEFVAFQPFTGKHNLAMAINMLRIPGIEIRGDRPSEQPDGEVEALNFAATLGYGRRFTSHLSLGVSAKMLYEKYYLETASGWAMDLGLLYQNLWFENLHFATSLLNLGRMNALKEKHTPLPFIWRSGIVYEYTLPLGQRKLEARLDYQFIRKESGRVNLGMEMQMLHRLYLRLGMILSDQNPRYTAGLGLKLKNLHLNFAYSPSPYDLGEARRLSLSWLF